MISKIKIRLKKKRNLVSCIAFLTLLISFKSSNQWSTLPIGNELFWWIIQFLFIYLLFKLKNSFTSPLVEKDFIFIKLYLYWIAICIIRGVFVADNYWEWKMLLATSYMLLLPSIAYLAISAGFIGIIIKTWFKYALFMFILVVPFLWGDAVGKFLIPVSFLILFFPVLNNKWKILVMAITLFVVTFDVTARSNIIKFLIPFLIGLLYYFRNTINAKLLNSFRLIMLISPLVLLVLAATNIFNVFKLDEYIGDYNINTQSVSGRVKKESLTSDTRTLLYVEVLVSAIKNEYILLGRTPSRGNDSKLFGYSVAKLIHSEKHERFSNEVSILNIFTWMGAIGVVLYFLVFFKATYLAINESSNIFIKIIGLNISFRWTYGFVEDFSQFDLSNIFLWIMIGMCFSRTFRKMTEQEMKIWVLNLIGVKGINIEKISNQTNLIQNQA